MLGKKSIYAAECFAGNFTSVDFDIDEDLTGELTDQWREFNKLSIAVFLTCHGEKSKIAAGLACGFLWTVAEGINKGDMVLCPDGSVRYRIGEVTGDYMYQPGGVLPHRHSVLWLSQTIDRGDMSEPLRNSAGSIRTVSNLLPDKTGVAKERPIAANF